MIPEQTTSLINWLHRGGKNGYYWLKLPPEGDQASGPKRTIWFDAGKPAPWPDGSYDLYFGVHPTKYVPKRKSKKTGRWISPHLLRAMLEDIAAINCLFAEFDAKHYRHGKEEAYAHIKSIPADPTVLIDSGGGYHAYWLLCEPILITDDFTRERFRKLQARWVNFVDGDPDSNDLARVLRVPGSYNYKYEPPREVSFVWADWDMPYELSDLTRLLPPEPAPEPAPQLTKPIPCYDQTKNPCSHFLDAALQRVIPGDSARGRNATGFWLACQLRDDGVPQATAEHVLLDFAARVRNGKSGDYTDEEARKSIASAYSKPAREPARGTTAYRPIRPMLQIKPKNGNSSEAPVKAPPAPTEVETPQQPEPQQPEPEPPVDKDNKTAILLAASHDHDGHAQCVLALYPEKFAYCEKWGWLHYTGTHWAMEGAEGAVNRAIIETLKARRIAAVHADVEPLVKVTKANASNVNGTRDILKNYVEVFTDDFDSDPDLLNSKNGVVNLRTGKLIPHSPKHRFTYCIPTEYDPAANYDSWLEFLKGAVNHNEIVDYLQVAVGYSLTGHTYEEVLFYLFGPPRSGKGTFTETLLSLLGNQPLATEVDFSTFTATRSGDTQNFDLAPLKPCRFVVASESNENQPLNPAKIKSLTGRNYVYCAFKHRDHFGYQPMFKIWLASNYPVNLTVEDDAAWGRVRVIEFPNSHLGEEDKTLKVQLSKPDVMKGILRWAVEGAQIWYELWQTTNGLPVPDVIAATAAQQRDQLDNIKAFLNECCVVRDDLSTPTGELYQAYKTWCETNGVPPKYHNKFTESLRKRGHPVVIRKDMNGKSIRAIQRIGLLA